MNVPGADHPGPGLRLRLGEGPESAEGFRSGPVAVVRGAGVLLGSPGRGLGLPRWRGPSDDDPTTGDRPLRMSLLWANHVDLKQK